MAGTCRAQTVSADVLEVQVRRGLKGLLCDFERLERDLRIARQEELRSQAPKLDELAAVVVSIRQAKLDADKIGVALLKASGVVEQSLQEKMDECNQRHDALLKRKAEQQDELSHQRLTDPAVRDILTYARDIAMGLEKATPELKRRMLEILDVEVTIRGSKYEAKSVLGTWE